MIFFVTGAAASGKSQLAETIATNLGGKLIYIATMPITSRESEKKARRHIKLREGKGFKTLERPNLLEPLPEASTVLLECVSTFTGNRMFAQEQPQDGVRELFEEIMALSKYNNNLVIVSAEVTSDGVLHNEYTENYKRVLSALNIMLAEVADTAVESVCGIPNLLKGNLSCLKA